MRLTSAPFVALTALIGAVSAGTSCKVKLYLVDGQTTTSKTVYTVTATGVGDIPGICGGLWDNLKPTIYPGGGQSCGGSNGNLQWVVPVWSYFSDAGDITSAWWRATTNNFGSIQCDGTGA